MATIDAGERRAHLLRLLERDGAVRLEEASGELGVSSMTVRRDLADLELEGLVRRVRGGAVPVDRPRTFGERLAERGAAKQAIAAKALDLVPSAGAVAVDASSTAGALLAALPRTPGLLVATNAAQNLAAARSGPGGTSVLVGGELEEATDSYVGPFACQMAQRLNYSVFFLSASGVTEAGTTEPTLREAQVKEAFAAVADRTVLLTDSSKLGRRSTVASLALDAVDLLITELEPDDARLDPYRGLVELR